MKGRSLLISAVIVAVCGYGFFFVLPLFFTSELLSTGRSPSGQWAYAIRYVDSEGASGAGAWEVEAHPVADPDDRYVVYLERGRPPGVRWRDDRTLEVNDDPIDVLNEGDSVKMKRIYKALVVTVPALGLALAGAFLHWRSQRGRPSGPLAEEGAG
jgi:hypothetical protein